MLRLLPCGLPSVAREVPDAVLAVPSDDDATSLGAWLDAVQPAIVGGDVVVALVPGRRPEPVLRHLRSVRSALDTTRLIVHTTTLPPLAATVVARTAVALVANGLATAELVASGWRNLERSSTALSWLGSVSRLEDPNPSLVHHVRSWFPGASFAVTVGDRASVVRVGRKADLLPVPDPAVLARMHVTVAHRGGDVPVVDRTLAYLQESGAQVEHLAPTTDGPAWWGTGELAEFVLTPRDWQHSADGLCEGQGPLRCGWCDVEVAGFPCALCGARAASPSTAVGGIR